MYILYTISGIAELLAECVPTYILPSRKRMTNELLPAKYDEVSNRVKEQLANAEFVTITTDMWTSISTEAFIAVTAHFVTQNWQLKSMLLDCCRFEGTHTGEHIRSGISNICQEWGIEDKVQAIVTDNARNMLCAVDLLAFSHWPCFAHTLNLIVKDAVETVQDLRSKVKTIVKYFNKSTTAADIFKKIQLGNTAAESGAGTPVVLDVVAVATNPHHDTSNTTDDEEPTTTTQVPETTPSRKRYYKLINDIDTRWNSTLHMFERVCLLQQPLVATIALLQNKRIKIASLDTDDFATMKEYCEIFEPFDDVTKELSAEKNVTGSKILVIVRTLIEIMQEHVANEDLTDGSKTLASKLLQGLQTRFRNIEQNHLLCMASFLDPRFKNRGLSDGVALQECKDAVESYIYDNLPTDDAERNASVNAVENRKKPSIWVKFDSLNGRDKLQKTPAAIASAELRQYVDEMATERHDDPLKWWSMHESTYPRIAKLARKHLSLVATSVPSERVFSKAGEVLSKKRNRLGNDNCNRILFLNGNMDNY